MFKLIHPLVAAFLFLFCVAETVQAFEVQEITSAKGIKAWLVESHDVPILSMNFSFSGGRIFERSGREGSHALLADMLVEGAGNLSSDEIKQSKVRMTSSFGFYSSADFTSGYLNTLTKNLEPTANLLKLTLEKPRFEEAAFERLRDQALQNETQSKVDQTSIADDAWFAAAFPGHIYGRSNRGTQASLKSLKTNDLRLLWTSLANRRDLRVAVVGDITAKELSTLLDKTFGDLPDFPIAKVAANVELAKGPVELRIKYEGPQTIVYFGNPGLADRGDEDWPSNVLAEILGGGASFARLTQALREKSGLTYSVNFSDYSWTHADVQLGSFSTASETAAQALTVLRQQMALMAKDGPTSEELRKTKSYINGSYPLRFSDNSSIASELLMVLERGKSVSYFKDRPGNVNAVTIENVRAAAAKLLKPENQIVVIVGKQGT
jgi:zinc protease